MKYTLVFFINIYKKFISPLKGDTCRFYPCCSTYAKDAILKYGAIKGTKLSIIRICKCNPFNQGGYDPVK